MTATARIRADSPAGGAVGVFAGNGDAEHPAGRSADVLDLGQRPRGDVFQVRSEIVVLPRCAAPVSASPGMVIALSMEVAPITAGELGEVESAIEVAPHQQPDRPENEDDGTRPVSSPI
jgi:hypothetical protein